MHKKVQVFDIVPFVRFNQRLGHDENFVAIWMKSSENEVFVHFASIGKSEFVRAACAAGIGFETGLTFNVREVYPATTEYAPPKGYDHCPERGVVIYPKMMETDFASELANQRREAKKEARLAKLFG